MSLNLLLRTLLPLLSNLFAIFPPLFELLSGLFILDELPEDSGLEGPLDEQAEAFEVFSDPETGDIDGADDEDASPVTETFLLSLSITADSEPFVRFGALDDVDATPAADKLVEVEFADELCDICCCCLTLDDGDDEMEDEA